MCMEPNYLKFPNLQVVATLCMVASTWSAFGSPACQGFGSGISLIAVLV
jgi:hypothetical protein